mmetsp:Transcript_25610/g.70687  ORF Transcript_25610/g.70687 Transcript_25610/m.70687 type:complete len:224 (-) Transcript_25610:42-713(-)
MWIIIGGTPEALKFILPHFFASVSWNDPCATDAATEQHSSKASNVLGHGLLLFSESLVALFGTPFFTIRKHLTQSIQSNAKGDRISRTLQESFAVSLGHVAEHFRELVQNFQSIVQNLLIAVHSHGQERNEQINHGRRRSPAGVDLAYTLNHFLVWRKNNGASDRDQKILICGADNCVHTTNGGGTIDEFACLGALQAVRMIDNVCDRFVVFLTQFRHRVNLI